MIKTKIKNIRILKNITPELIAGKLNISVGTEDFPIEKNDFPIKKNKKTSVCR